MNRGFPAALYEREGREPHTEGMATTMVRMEDTVNLVRERGLKAKVIIGGAVVTEKFCSAIGANGWSTDAMAAVKLAQRLVQ